jgi:hypothetical protein
MENQGKNTCWKKSRDVYLKTLALIVICLFSFSILFSQETGRTQEIVAKKQNLYEALYKNNIDIAIKIKAELDKINDASAFAVYDDDEEICIEMLLKNYKVLTDVEELERLIKKSKENELRINLGNGFLREKLKLLLLSRNQVIKYETQMTDEENDFYKIVFFWFTVRDADEDAVVRLSKAVSEFIESYPESRRTEYLITKHIGQARRYSLKLLAGVNFLVNNGFDTERKMPVGFDFGVSITVPHVNFTGTAGVLFAGRIQKDFIIENTSFPSDYKFLINQFNFQIGYPIRTSIMTLIPQSGITFVGYQYSKGSDDDQENEAVYRSNLNISLSMESPDLKHPLQKKLRFIAVRYIIGVYVPFDIFQDNGQYVQIYSKICLSLGPTFTVLRRSDGYED